MFVNEPIVEYTFRNWSGRCHAALNAQMPPLLLPQMPRPYGSSVMTTCCRASGKISSSRNRA